MSANPLNVLFVGNSYTYYNQMPEEAFTSIAREAGYEVSVTSVTHGGYRLDQFADPDNEEGVRLRETICGVHYDFAVLQEQSVTPIKNEEAFLAGISGVMDLISADKFILYATWGRNDGSPTLTELGLTREEMTEKLSLAYNAAGKRFGARVAEVGRAFLEYSKDHSKDDLYNPDMSHPSEVGSALAARVIFEQMTK